VAGGAVKDLSRGRLGPCRTVRVVGAKIDLVIALASAPLPTIWSSGNRT